MEYLLKASAVIAIFYFCYILFLQRDTFFKTNRWFLLLGLFTAFFIPFIVIPIYVEQTPVLIGNYVFGDTGVTENIEQSITVLQVLTIIYALGIVFFLGRFLIQLSSLGIVLIKNDAVKHGRYSYIKTTDNISPFSFFNWIVFNPDLFNEDELKQIITHEKVHARQHHSIDILLTQLSCVVLWFNPFVWLYNKDLKQNLEFIADQNAQRKSDCKKSYQYTLLKTSMPTQQLALTNNFYNSLIKKRIVMLHKSKSKKTNLFKYALILPVLAIFFMSFNTKKVFITKEIPVTENPISINAFTEESEITVEEKTLKQTPKKKPATNTQVNKAVVTNLNSNTKTAKNYGNTQMVLITKDFKDADFDKVKSKLKKEGITVKFKGIKRNSNGEITAIKIDISSKQSSANYNVSSDEAIKPIKISYDRGGGNISIGNGHPIHVSSNGNGFYFKSKDGSTGSSSSVYVISDDDDDIDVDEDVIIIKNGNKIIDLHKVDENIIIEGKGGKAYKVRTIGKGKSGNTFFISSDDDAEPLYIVDGKEVEKDAFEDIDSDDIESVRVFKDDNATKKFGKKGKNGVVKIVTKKKGKSRNTFFISSDDGAEPLYIIDGKEAKKDAFEDLDADDIKSVSVLKGNSAIEKYGDKAKNGVVEITTKKK